MRGRSVRFTDVSDRLPLFPLNMVLFPGIVMPLHIFEDRYRSLVRDLIALPPESDREFGVVAIKVGYEVGERGVHTIQRTGCAALVTEVTANPDGTFEILVVGRRRFHVENLDPSEEYLRADVEWLSDRPGGDSPADAVRAARVARNLFEVYRDSVAALRGDDILEGAAPDDPVDLSYTLAAALVLNLAQRQTMLEAPDVTSRLRLGTSLMRGELQAMKAIPSLPATAMARTAWSPN
jgi:Lon protease-like protein